MKIIVSPAKKMRVQSDDFPITGYPVYLNRTETLLKHLQSLSFTELKQVWKCSQKLAEMNYERIRKMDLRTNLTPAILAYEGLQYQYMAPHIFTSDALDYVQQHLCILSGFYGILSPFDGVVPYRLEMASKLSIGQHENLYDFWGDALYAIAAADHKIVNLASQEYSQCISRYLQDGDTFVTVVFGELKNQKIIQKGTMAKMARGEMVRYLSEHQIDDFEGLKSFHDLHYTFAPEYSDDHTYVFLKGAV